MALRFPKELVFATLANADALALEGEVLEAWEGYQDWAERVVALSADEAPRTPLASLATALTARAMSDQVDARSLMAGDGERGYSAAAVARVLVEYCGDHRISLRGIGPVPFNNSPFNGKRRVEADWQNVLSTAVPYLQKLTHYLDLANELTEDEAERALAVLIRIRRSLTGAQTQKQLDLGDSYPIFRGIVADAAEFIDRDPEDGRRGQAAVAALLELVFPVVKTYRVNDPGRVLPGDVHAGLTDHPTLFVEVKQKTVPGSEVERFAESVASSGGGRAIYVALRNATQEQIDLPRAASKASVLHKVAVLVFVDLVKFADHVFTWAGTVDDCTGRFATRMSFWMQRIGCADDSLVQWNELAGRSTTLDV